MGLGGSDPSAEERSAAEIYCSICLDVVIYGGDRSAAKLQCGHEFHLDCIGSAFNAKGVMQCPNCREIGQGNWLYSSGSRSRRSLSRRSLAHRSFDEWTHDEDLYDFNYPEMASGVHWCPFSRLARVLPSFDEGETSPGLAFQDTVGYHAMFTGNSAALSASNQCPYLAYMPAHQPSSSSDPSIFAHSQNDGSTFHRHWSRASRQTDIQTRPIIPAVDIHYHNWEHHSAMYTQPSSHSPGSNQNTEASAMLGSVRLGLDGLPREGSPVHQFVRGHGSSSASTGPFMSTVAAPYFASSQSLPHVRENPQNAHGSILSRPRRSGPRGLPAMGPHLPLDQTSYHLFPPTTSSSSSSSRSSQGSESMRSDRFYSIGRDGFVPFPLLPLPGSTGSPNPRSRWGLWHRNGSERPSSPSYGPFVSRMRPYN